jgi:hypothetical protein
LDPLQSSEVDEGREDLSSKENARARKDVESSCSRRGGDDVRYGNASSSSGELDVLDGNSVTSSSGRAAVLLVIRRMEIASESDLIYGKVF